MKSKKPPTLLFRVLHLGQRLTRMEGTLKDVAKKANDHGNEIYALQHPIAPDIANRVVNNQAAEAVASPKSSMNKVCERVCHINGHLIAAIIEETPTVPTVSLVVTRKTIVLCQHCGMTLEEIRTAK